LIYLSECKKKFGEEFGNEVWEEINKTFDCMPVAALVDKKIFCIHGGIPSEDNLKSLSDINKIPVPLKDPESQSALAWELRWNDPLPLINY